MGETTGISWCDATFNPWWGCTKVSPGCDLCYAELDSKRYGHEVWGKDAPRRMLSDHNWNEPLRWNRKAEAAKKRWRVFCGSMCDILEDRRDLDAVRDRLWEVIDHTPWLEWLLVSKRPQNFHRMMPRRFFDSNLPNLRLMTTVENVDFVWRLEELAKVSFMYTGVSYEPAIGPVDFTPYLDDIDWVILGGESQPGCRPMDLAWARKTISDCRRHDVPCFVKQLGGFPDKRSSPKAWPEDLRVQEFPYFP
jgi:protein gp37